MMPFIAVKPRSCSSQSSGLGDHAETLAGIDFVPERAPPPLVVDIPAHRFLDPALERLLRAPAKLALEFGRVDGVALVVAGPVGDKGDERLVRARTRAKVIKNRADASHDVNVAAFVAAADIVFFADAPARHDQIERS